MLVFYQNDGILLVGLFAYKRLPLACQVKRKNAMPLKQFHYRAITKRQKGIVIRILLQVTGYSRQQLTRLINQYLKTGVVQLNKVHKPPGFKQK